MYLTGRLRGSKVRIVNATSRTLGIAYAPADEELSSLDPSVGVQEKPTFFSIYTNRYVLIGICSMYNYTGKQVELGIRIWDRDYWGKGYGTEAISLLCEWTLANTGVKEILVKAVKTNARAIRAYEKCGFEVTGEEVIDGHDMVWMRKRR